MPMCDPQAGTTDYANVIITSTILRWHSTYSYKKQPLFYIGGKIQIQYWKNYDVY